MEFQTTIDLVAGAVLAVVGWFARQLFYAVEELRKDVRDIEINLPSNYVQKDDFKEAIADLKKDIRDSNVDLKNSLNQVFAKIRQEAQK